MTASRTTHSGGEEHPAAACDTANTVGTAAATARTGTGTTTGGTGAIRAGRRAGARERPWLAVTVIALAQLMIALDATIMSIALPSAQHALGFVDGQRQWVITAYLLPYAGLLLLGGRIGDRYGRRRTFLGGLAGFAAASALAGAAPDLGLLVTGRALQGACAAVLAPTALALLSTTFTDARSRARAFGIYGAVASSGAATGLLLGGALTQYAGWRWCLYVNIAVATAGITAGWAVLPEPAGHGGTRIDLAGGVLATAGLAAVVFGCGRAGTDGWSGAGVWLPLAGGTVLLAAFLATQARRADALLPLPLLRHRARAGAYLAAAAGVLGSYGMSLLLTYHFQVVLHYPPLRAGLAFLPLTAAVSASAYAIASRALPHVPARTLIVPGLLVAAGGLALLSRLHPSSGYLGVILPAQLLLGLGIGCVVTPAISVATTGVPPREAGVAAAVANTAMQIGGSLGTAVLNTVAVAATTTYLAGHRQPPGAAGLVHGYTTATAVAAVLLAVVALVAWATIRTGARPRPHGGVRRIETEH